MNRNDDEYVDGLVVIGKAEVPDKEFLFELSRIGIETGRKLEIGRQYFAIDGLRSYFRIRIRAFTVTGNGTKPDIWEGDLALDRNDLANEDGTEVTDEQWEEHVSENGGNWCLKSEWAEKDLHDSPEDAREAAAAWIWWERNHLEDNLKGLRSIEAALLKWDGLLCLPSSDQ